MEIVKNTDYFVAQLNVHNDGNSPVINQLISEMVTYATQLESNQIPIGISRPQKPKPTGDLKSTEFEEVINQNSISIDSELLHVLQEFLVYIKMLENQELS